MERLEVDRDARLLLASQWIAQAADGVMQAALANLLILEPEATGSRLLAVTSLTLVPYSFIAPFMGVFVDRWARRSVLVFTNVARALLLLALSFVVRSSTSDIPLYVGLLILLGIGRLFLTTKGAALPVVFHERQLLKGNSLSGGGGMVAALIGGVLGLVTVGVIDTAEALLVAVAAYLGSAAVARRMANPLAHGLRTDTQIADEFARVWRDMSGGVGEVARRAATRIPLIGIFIVRTAAMLAAFAAIVIIKNEYPDAADEFGRLSSGALALGAAGVGAFLGALIAPALNRRWNEPRLMIGGFVFSGIGIMTLGGLESIPAVLGLTFVGGLGGFIAKVSVDALLQMNLQDHYRGRGFAIYDVIYNMASVGAAALVLVAGEEGLREFLIGAGAATLVLAWLLNSALQRTSMLTSTPYSRQPL